MQNKRFTVLIIIMLFTMLRNLSADQEVIKVKKTRLNHELGIKANLGAQIFSQYVIYESGVNISYSADYNLNNTISIGPGIAYDIFDDVSFIPMTINIRAYITPNAHSFYFNSEIGYSVADDKSKIKLSNYEYKGGFNIAVGFGYSLRLSHNGKLLFNLSYRHQDLNIEYHSFSGQDYTESTGYDFVGFGLGVIF